MMPVSSGPPASRVFAMGSVMQILYSGGVSRERAQWRSAWAVMVVVVFTGLAATAGEVAAQDYYYYYTDDQQPNITNKSDSSSPPRFATEYIKCRCEGNQVFDGIQCMDKQTSVSVMSPDSQSAVIALTDDFEGVVVREVQCPTNYSVVHLDPNKDHSYQFTLLPSGILSWQGHEYEQYCLEHTFTANGELTWEAKVCLPPPSVPHCCSNSLPCPDYQTVPFSPPILVGQEFVKWPNMKTETGMKCNKFEKSINVSLNTGGSNLLYESGDVLLAWETPFHIKSKNKDGFCVTAQEGGSYMATVCYEDHEALHLTFCENSTCVRKCCPNGHIHGMPDCVPVESVDNLWEPSFVDAENLTNVPPPKDWKIMYGRPQCPMFQADPQVENDRFYLLENGFLFTPALMEKDPPTRYCIDSFLNSDNTVSTRALICFSEAPPEPVCAIAKKSLYPALLLVSSAFLGITVAIYLSMPDLRNRLHGRCLISLASAFFVAYILMAVSYLSESLTDTTSCIALAFFKHLSLLAAFFWLNVMCFDIWRTLRKTRVIDGGLWGMRRFLWYCLYSWGCPLLIAIAAVVVELLPPYKHVIKPNFSNDFCWFSGKASMWLYFYLWVSLLVVANIIFFGLVVVILVSGQRNSMLRRSREVNRERMWLYVKLFLVMGVTWIAEMVSYQSGKCAGWIFTDIINALQGFTLFLVFILNRSTLRKIKEKWCGRPKSALSPTNTVSSGFSDSSQKQKANYKSSLASRFSDMSVSIKDENRESAVPLNTVSEAPE